MEKLTILEFDVQDINIHIFDLPTDQDASEDYVRSLGFNPTSCMWFTGCNVNVYGN